MPVTLKVSHPDGTLAPYTLGPLNKPPDTPLVRCDYTPFRCRVAISRNLSDQVASDKEHRHDDSRM